VQGWSLLMKETPGNGLQSVPVPLSLNLHQLLLRHPKIRRTDRQAGFTLDSVAHSSGRVMVGSAKLGTHLLWAALQD